MELKGLNYNDVALYDEINTTIIHGFLKGPSLLTSLFLSMDMYILTINLGLEWHVYFWLVNLTKMTYLIISNQVGQKNDHFGQND